MHFSSMQLNLFYFSAFCVFMHSYYVILLVDYDNQWHHFRQIAYWTLVFVSGYI